MLTANDINQMLQGWCESPGGKKELQEKGFMSLTKEEMKAIAQELADALYQAGKDVVKTKGRSLFWKGWGSDGSWTIRVFQNDKDQKVRLICDEESLKRKSFTKVEGKGQSIIGYTGKGVYDIVGLFTHGYMASRFASGYWETAGKFSLSHSLGGAPGLAPNAFIDNVIEAFKVRHSNTVTDVIYPSLWHSK